MRNRWLYRVFLLAMVFLLGAVAHRYRSKMIDGQFLRDHFHFRKSINLSDTSLFRGRVMVFLAFGQSNAANYGLGEYLPKNEVYNYYNGKLYEAKEPLLGPDGKGSSVWTRVADLAIDSGLYDKAIIVPCGIGQTSVLCWSQGECYRKLDEILRDLQEKEIGLTHIFWCQGETDNVDGTTAENYEAELGNIINNIRNRGIDAPFFVSLTSFFPFNNDNPMGVSQSIREGQLSVVDSAKHVFPGPDLDKLNLAYYRYDAVHFSENGLDTLAMEWFRKIK